MSWILCFVHVAANIKYLSDPTCKRLPGAIALSNVLSSFPCKQSTRKWKEREWISITSNVRFKYVLLLLLSNNFRWGIKNIYYEQGMELVHQSPGNDRPITGNVSPLNPNFLSKRFQSSSLPWSSLCAKHDRVSSSQFSYGRSWGRSKCSFLAHTHANDLSSWLKSWTG